MENFLDQDIIGLYQLCPDGKISKYELLKKFAKFWYKDIEIEENPNYEVDKSLVCIRTDFIYKNSRPSFENMLMETKNWMDKHPSLYSHYNED